MNPKILIEPIISGKEHGYAIQTQKFRFLLQITNLSEQPSPAFTISSIILKSAEGQDINDNFNGKSFFVDILNPSQEKIIYVGDSGQFMYGLVNVSAAIQPREQNILIDFYQKNPFTKETSKIPRQNNWTDFFYIKSSNESSQEKTNIRIYWLTWATVALALIQVLAIPKVHSFISAIFKFVF